MATAVAVVLAALLASCMAPAPTADRTPAPAYVGTALAALATLPVKGKAPMTGYARHLFGAAWTDDNDEVGGHNGCDTRNDILRRDLTRLTMRGRCTVASGTLVDPYTGLSYPFVRGVGTSSQVQIDHVVALGDAWKTGAQGWTPQRRRDFANDPLELLATRGSINQAKGDADAATWLPPRKVFRCVYVARIVAVKARWHLWVKPAERDAIARVLRSCPNEPLPVEPGRVVAVRSALLTGR